RATVESAEGEQDVVVGFPGWGEVAAHDSLADEAGLRRHTLRGAVRLADAELDPPGCEFVEAPAGNERDGGGGDAAVAVRGRNAVAELDRGLLAQPKEDDPDHLVRFGVGDDQRRPGPVLRLPPAAELVDALDRLGAAARCRDRHPDRLLDIG